MNVGRLISKVKEHNCLWDYNDRNHKNKHVINQTWEDIAREMGCTIPTCRQKWRSLRDVFRREFRKYKIRLDNPNIRNKDPPRWHHFEELSFLTQQMLGVEVSQGFREETSRQSSNDLQDEPFESMYMTDSRSSDPIKAEPNVLDFSLGDDYANGIDDVEEDGTEIIELRTSPSSSSKRALSNFRDSRGGKRPRLKEEGSKDSDSDKDSDYHFLMSLLPYLRDVPYERKLLVRTKLQTVLSEELLLGQRDKT